MPDKICVGAIAGAFGVRGEAKIKCFTDDPAAIGDYGPLATEDGTRQFTLKLTRQIKGGYAAHLSDVATREDAEALKGTRLYAERSALPEPDEEEFYYTDLLGLRIETADGTLIGEIKAVQDFGAGDVIEYVPEGGGETLYLPFTLEVVPTVDLAGGRIVAELPEEVDAGDQ
jgi:16S rRNA processing protein RimM